MRTLPAVQITRRDANDAALCNGATARGTGSAVARYARVATHAIGEGDAPAGAIVADIDIRAVQAGLEQNKLSRGSLAVVTDAEGRAVQRVAARGVPQFDIALSFGNAVRGESADGHRWIYASAPLIDRKLFIVYAEPEQQLIAPIMATFRVDLLLSVLTIFLTSIVVWWGVNAFVIPVASPYRYAGDGAGRG